MVEPHIPLVQYHALCFLLSVRFLLLIRVPLNFSLIAANMRTHRVVAAVTTLASTLVGAQVYSKSKLPALLLSTRH